MTKKPRNINYIVDEILARNVLWTLNKPESCRNCVTYNKSTKAFSVTNVNKWIELTWKNSYVGLQRFAFQHLYNTKFSKETLGSLDERFGQVSTSEIELFQQEVKNICSWRLLDSKEGYKTFLTYFGLNTDDYETKLKNAFMRSSSCGYHSFVAGKEWAPYIN